MGIIYWLHAAYLGRTWNLLFRVEGSGILPFLSSYAYLGVVNDIWGHDFGGPQMIVFWSPYWGQVLMVTTIYVCPSININDYKLGCC